jgi:hypothetical protein
MSEAFSLWLMDLAAAILKRRVFISVPLPNDTPRGFHS